MLGGGIGEASGSVTGARALSVDDDGSRIEVSFSGSGQVLGVSITDIGTFVQTVRPGGDLGSEDSNVVMLTGAGEIVSWTGFGAGRPTGRGLESSWGMVGAMRTSSERLARLNSVVTVIEYEVDKNGGYRWKAWEWTGSGGPPLPSCEVLRGEQEPVKLDGCPVCETGELRPNPFLVRCSGCGYAISRDMFRTLRQVRSLPGTSEGRAWNMRARRSPEEPAA
jgi:hypothetical protein